jgi:hypothetical protein
MQITVDKSFLHEDELQNIFHSTLMYHAIFVRIADESFLPKVQSRVIPVKMEKRDMWILATADFVIHTFQRVMKETLMYVSIAIPTKISFIVESAIKQ